MEVSAGSKQQGRRSSSFLVATLSIVLVSFAFARSAEAEYFSSDQDAANSHHILWLKYNNGEMELESSEGESSTDIIIKMYNHKDETNDSSQKDYLLLPSQGFHGPTMPPQSSEPPPKPHHPPPSIPAFPPTVAPSPEPQPQPPSVISPPPPPTVQPPTPPPTIPPPHPSVSPPPPPPSITPPPPSISPPPPPSISPPPPTIPPPSPSISPPPPPSISPPPPTIPPPVPPTPSTSVRFDGLSSLVIVCLFLCFTTL